MDEDSMSKYLRYDKTRFDQLNHMYEITKVFSDGSRSIQRIPYEYVLDLYKDFLIFPDVALERGNSAMDGK